MATEACVDIPIRWAFIDSSTSFLIFLKKSKFLQSLLILNKKLLTFRITLNKCIIGRTRKEYLEASKEKIKEQEKEYQIGNEDKIKEY